MYLKLNFQKILMNQFRNRLLPNLQLKRKELRRKVIKNQKSLKNTKNHIKDIQVILIIHHHCRIQVHFLTQKD